MGTEALLRRFYDEKYNGTAIFYSLLRRTVCSGSCILNCAGAATRNPVRSLKGEVAKVVGVNTT